MLTFSMDALFIRGMRKHRHLGTLRCRQEGASTASIRPRNCERRRSPWWPREGETVRAETGFYALTLVADFSILKRLKLSMPWAKHGLPGACWLQPVRMHPRDSVSAHDQEAANAMCRWSAQPGVQRDRENDSILGRRCAVERYDFEVVKGDQTVATTGHVALFGPRVIWRRIAELANSVDAPGCRIRFTEQSGRIVILVRVTAARHCLESDAVPRAPLQQFVAPGPVSEIPRTLDPQWARGTDMARTALSRLRPRSRHLRARRSDGCPPECHPATEASV
jgi:hypothetical protein